MGGIVDEDISTWSTEKVAKWISDVGMPASIAETFTSNEIDGRALMVLTDEEMKTEMNIKLGHRKVILFERNKLIGAPSPSAASTTSTVVAAAPSPVTTTAVDSPPAPSTPPPLVPGGKLSFPPPAPPRALFTNSSSLRLAKGFLGEGGPLSERDRERIRTQVFDPARKVYVRRDPPLNDEELACWEYQHSWLVCPISGKRWRDNDSILGVGLYHPPRFLSDREKKRLTEEESAAFYWRRGGGREILEGGGAATGTASGGDGEWEREFDPYPTVDPPPPENIDDIGDLPRDVNMAAVDVIVGPAFDIRAYNWGIEGGGEGRGIKSQRTRGVVSMDQQYNAVNFIYFLLRSHNSFERKRCTNRLSFYIEESHGSRVFPTNIESQLSLLMFRDKRVLGSGGGTDQVLLAECIKKAIPNILKGIVMELIHGRDTAVENRIEHALRTYLLIHQVSLRLICYYPTAYNNIYRSVMTWIQNPFARQFVNAWGDIEEVLIASSLVGIPWTMLRESFIRKFVFDLLANTPKKEGGLSPKERQENLFNANKERIVRVLTEFSFFMTPSSIADLNKKYARCAGSLPERERLAMIAQVHAMRNVKSLAECWVIFGFEPHGSPPELIEERIDAVIRRVISKSAEWRKNETPGLPATFRPPPIDGQNWTEDSAIHRAKDQDRQRKVAADKQSDHQRMIQIHQGYPTLPSPSSLGGCVCLYEGCGKTFATRGLLFQHLKRYIQPKARMIRNYHKCHFVLAHPPPPSAGRCSAVNCSFVASNEEEMRAHYVQMGVRGCAETSSPVAADAAAAASSTPPLPSSAAAGGAAAVVDYESSSSLCVVCADNERSMVFVPCGHFVCCQSCVKLMPKSALCCPICRQNVRDTVQVFFS